MSLASTKVILTWKQVIGKETMSNVVPAAKNMYKLLGKHSNDVGTIVDGKRIYVYEVHDGKMIYNLTYHSKWNRKYHPFILCACHRGDGVVDPEHTCNIVTDETNSQLFVKLLLKYEEKKKKDPTYNEVAHRDYCDKQLKGCTHFGFKSLKLRRSSIRFDIFHLCAQMTRKLLEHLRKFIRKHNSTIQLDFAKTLLSIWGEFKVNWWNFNKQFGKFKGPELLDFIINTETVAEFITKTFRSDGEAREIIEYLTLWASVTEFQTITDIRKKEA